MRGNSWLERKSKTFGIIAKLDNCVEFKTVKQDFVLPKKFSAATYWKGSTVSVFIALVAEEQQ